MEKLIVLILLAAFSACAHKHHTPPSTIEPKTVAVEEVAPSREEVQLIEATAQVVAVNHKTRRVTLRMENGKTASFKAGPEIKRLKEIRKGDTVKAQVYQSLALELREPTKEEKNKPTTAFLAAERGREDLPPEVATLSVIHTIVTVVAIDRDAETVRVELPSGKKHTVRARDPKNLELLKVGDTIAVTYTQAVAVSIEPLNRERKGKKNK